MNWQTHRKEYLLKSKWLTVRKDSVSLPSGYEIDDFYVLEYPDCVSVIAITEDGYFIMEEQYRHGLQKTCIELCAGRCEDGDTPIETAKRELLEETGYGGGIWSEFMISSPNPSSMTNICHTYLAKGVRKLSPQSLECSEDITIHLCSKEQVMEWLNDFSIIEGVMQASLLKYFSEKTKDGR